MSLAIKVVEKVPFKTEELVGYFKISYKLKSCSWDNSLGFVEPLNRIKVIITNFWLRQRCKGSKVNSIRSNQTINVMKEIGIDFLSSQKLGHIFFK